MPADQSGSLEGLAVVVVNYQSHQLIEENLGLLDRAEGVRFVVVDAFSTKDEREATRNMCGHHAWDFVAMEDNRGFGAGANAGVDRAMQLGSRSLLLLNPDARIDEPGVRRLTRQALAEPLSLVCPRIERPDGATWFAGAVVDRTDGVPGRRPNADVAIPWVTGACLAMSVETWRSLGGFDDKYFMYWEDIDLSYRCTSAGGRLIVAEEVTVVHEVGATQGASKSPLYVRFCCRNRLVFAAKHLERVEKLRWILMTPRSSWLIARRGRGRRDLLTSPRILGAMFAGSLAGVRAVVVSLVR